MNDSTSSYSTGDNAMGEIILASQIDNSNSLSPKNQSIIGFEKRQGKLEEMPEKHTEDINTAVLAELARLRAEFLANISQELRTPLTSIKGFVSTLLQPDIKWSEKERREFLESIEQEANRLNHLISGLLDMTRIENGSLKLKRTVCKISDIFNEISEQLKIITRHHCLQLKIQPGLPAVWIDRERIEEVILNLVKNATKYSKESKPVILEAKYSHQQVMVSIIDNGVGIPARLVDKVFDRFYQVENIVSGLCERNSIGLAACRGIIEAHGCKIWVESRVGSGSRFNFTLPVNVEVKGNNQFAPQVEGFKGE